MRKIFTEDNCEQTMGNLFFDLNVAVNVSHNRFFMEHNSAVQLRKEFFPGLTYLRSYRMPMVFSLHGTVSTPASDLIDVLEETLNTEGERGERRRKKAALMG